jgi:class 3 adenylate cyclase
MEMVHEIEAFLGDDEPVRIDRALAAVLFTDIVGSTRQLAAVGDSAWHFVLDAHDALVAAEVERHGGRVIRPTGDGAVARFGCVRSAVWCGLAVRDAVADLGLEVRAGVHAGEVELRGGDISGIAVHVAHRICRVATAGQVLASRTAVDLLAGSGLDFEPAGTHSLKGINDEWPLFAAVADRFHGDGSSQIVGG